MSAVENQSHRGQAKEESSIGGALATVQSSAGECITGHPISQRRNSLSHWRYSRIGSCRRSLKWATATSTV